MELLRPDEHVDFSRLQKVDSILLVTYTVAGIAESR